MGKITGIKSVDIKITASGHGAVNWNGKTTLSGADRELVDNHSMPKLRGYSPYNGKVKEDTGFKFRKQLNEVDLKETPLYIGQNCIRHHLFRDQNYDSHFAGAKSNARKLLASISGLLRGYVIPQTQFKRTSPVLVEDFVDQLGNGNFEQFSSDTASDVTENASGEKIYTRPSTSIFSKITFGETEYIGYASISIEDLQFISLDQKFDKCSLAIKKGQGEVIAKELSDFIKTLDEHDEYQPAAVFHENYVRLGTIFDEGEVGILLNDDAIHLLVLEMISRFEDLYIKQAKGYMVVDDVMVDFNDSQKPMRIKKNPEAVVSVKNEVYATYFAGV